MALGLESCQCRREGMGILYQYSVDLAKCGALSDGSAGQLCILCIEVLKADLAHRNTKHRFKFNGKNGANSASAASLG